MPNEKGRISPFAFSDLLELLSAAPTPIIQEAFAKAYHKIHGYTNEDGSATPVYERIMVSISGGSDSDIMLDFIERIGYPVGNIQYVFFDTGVEFEATKKHLDFLENKYGIIIHRERAVTPVPLGVKKHGVPFMSKQISEYMSRLQRHGFRWEDKPFEELYAEYPHCKAALRWWCNRFGENSKMNIDRKKYLKEFIISNPPDFPISPKCCIGAKKNTAHAIERRFQPTLDVQGVRKSEGGVRATAYRSCFDHTATGCDKLRPIFWFTKKDKEEYAERFGVEHSQCYTTYGLSRTGCACCPFGSNFENELQAARLHEPKLYAAAVNLFGKSYEYTRKYKAFVRAFKAAQEVCQ